MKTPVRYVAIAIASLSLVMFINLGNVSADTPDESAGFGKAANAMNPLNWKMPKIKMPNFKNLLPSKTEQAAINEKKDGLFDKVGKTASNSWSKTKTALSPKNLNPARFFTGSSKSAVQRSPVKVALQYRPHLLTRPLRMSPKQVWSLVLTSLLFPVLQQFHHLPTSLFQLKRRQ